MIDHVAMCVGYAVFGWCALVGGILTFWVMARVAFLICDRAYRRMKCAEIFMRFLMWRKQNGYWNPAEK